MRFDPRVTPARGDLAASHLRNSVRAERYADGEALMVGVPLTPLRTAAGEQASLGSQLLFGEEFIAYDTSNGWSWGQATRDAYVGYVRRDALRALGPAPRHRIGVLRALVFPEPDLKRPVIGALALNTRVAIARAVGEFFEVESLGWVPKRHVAPEHQVSRDMVGIAEKFVGVPYLWGGRTQEGLDCSGLVQTAFEAAGRIVPRDTDLIAGALSREVEPPLQRGDLIFWRGHVGIMVDSSTLIHANAFHMAVAIEPLNDVIARQDACNEAVARMARP
jgi:cell wall-associated NlpC family hydrolase